MAPADLPEYRRKRDFRRTPEPAPARAGKEKGGRPLSFVVQKHAARRLHHDFRLEMGGALKSWAVPRGPSLDPRERRLAVEVEDHPLEYGSFEGVIPAGEYGGGPVIVWDRGVWIPRDEDPLRAWRRGRLKFVLVGEKLRGGWNLVRMGGKDEGGKRNWLLIKENDGEARRGPEAEIVERLPRSVLSGRTIEEVARRPGEVWTSKPRQGDPPRRSLPDPSRIPGARRAVLPAKVLPQLATLVEEPPAGDEWLHEIKHDGYRALCRIEKEAARFTTRRGLDWTERFRALAEAAAGLPVERALLDGEVVKLEADGTSSFQALQNALSTGGRGLVYQVFDLLHLDGWDLTRAPLEARKEALAALLRASAGAETAIRFSDHVIGHGKDFQEKACRFALEGVVSKRRNAPYRPGRGHDWRKTKCLHREEFVVGGFTEPAGSRSGLGSLLLGVNRPGTGLVYSGKVGTGFSERTLEDLRRRLGALERRASPFVEPPPRVVARAARWVEPELVAEVEFLGRTRDGLLRHPSFEGLREDKGPEEVVEEKPAAPDPPAESAPAAFRITHPERVIDADSGTTKGDLAEYHRSVARLMLPHLTGRPLMLRRCPDGVKGSCFYQKHAGRGLPPAIRPTTVIERGKEAAGISIEDEEGLLALVQMNAIEVHVWGCRADKIERPDRLVFDLDPAPDVPWSRVTAAALEMRAFLEDLGLRSWLKTTGGKGLHVLVPIARRHGWDDVKTFTRAVAEEMVRRAPARYTSSLTLARRPGKIFIDWLRNARGATWVAPFSARARPGVPVSAPIAWEELGPALRSDHFNVKSFPRRLAARKKDPWEGFLEEKQGLAGAMRRMGTDRPL